MVGLDADVAGLLWMVGVGRGSTFADPAAVGGGGCEMRYVECDGWGGEGARDEETTAAMGGRERASLGDRPWLDPLFVDVPNEEGARKDWPAGYCPKYGEVRKDWFVSESRKE